MLVCASLCLRAFIFAPCTSSCQAMSTYYFVVCDEHCVRCDAASRLAGGSVCGLGHSFMLPTFLVAHENCGVRLTSEHEDGAVWDYDEPYKDAPDPADADREDRAGLLARAQDAESEVKRLRALYGSPA